MSAGAILTFIAEQTPSEIDSDHYCVSAAMLADIDLQREVRDLSAAPIAQQHHPPPAANAANANLTARPTDEGNAS